MKRGVAPIWGFSMLVLSYLSGCAVNGNWNTGSSFRPAAEISIQGDYPTDRLDESLRLAYQGDATGQNNVGSMYAQGWGVAQDYAEAVRWYRKAAEQGNTRARTILGMMYAD